VAKCPLVTLKKSSLPRRGHPLVRPHPHKHLHRVDRPVVVLAEA
jgi:hypothetical protein